jgi:hypothetical protein
MKRDAVIAGLSVRRGLQLDRDTWTAAAMLAGLRVAANDAIRVADRDRGEHKNQLADLWGVIGELIALRVVEQVWDGPVEHHPIDFERSVDEVDVTVRAADRPLLLEAKAHLIELGNKRWFLINKRAHRRSLRRGATAYMPILTAVGARRAVAGPLIATSTVDGWGPPDIPLKDPAVGVLLEPFLASHFGVEQMNAPDVPAPAELIGPDELEAYAIRAGADLQRWRAELPVLERLHAREVVAAVLEAHERIGRGR